MVEVVPSEVGNLLSEAIPAEVESPCPAGEEAPVVPENLDLLHHVQEAALAEAGNLFVHVIGVILFVMETLCP